MSVQQTTISKVPDRTVRYVYLITVFLLTLTGFGQMPIFKRYYIADIPGLGWLAQFYVTHYIHYLAAIIVLALVAYRVIDYLILQRKHLRLTASGYTRGAIVAGILLSGLLLVIRNQAGSRLDSRLIILLDLAHLGLVIAFLTIAGYCLILKKQWTNAR
jgi:hypothetical protein